MFLIGASRAYAFWYMLCLHSKSGRFLPTQLPPPFVVSLFSSAFARSGSMRGQLASVGSGAGFRFGAGARLYGSILLHVIGSKFHALRP